MSDLQQKLDKFKAEATEQLALAGVSNVDDDVLTQLVNNLKLVIDNRDALYVAGSDDSELETVRTNFVAKKLGVSDKETGSAAVKKVADQMSGSRLKNRAAFYYLVKQELA